MTDETRRDVDVLDELRDELAAVAPSAAFAARVRAEAATRAERPGWQSLWHRAWRLPAAGLAAAAVVALGWVGWPGDGPATNVAQVRLPDPVGVAPPDTTASVPPVTARPEPTTGVAAPAQSRARAVPATSAAPHDPFLEIITDQPVLLKAYWARLAAARVEVDATQPDVLFEVPKIEIAPIEVEPIRVPLLAIPAAQAGDNPIIRRASAGSAERSTK